MLGKQFVGADDEVRELFRERTLRQVLTYAFPADVVGRRELHIRAAVRYDEAMAVTHPRVERKAVAAEFFCKNSTSSRASGVVISPAE